MIMELVPLSNYCAIFSWIRITFETCFTFLQNQRVKHTSRPIQYCTLWNLNVLNLCFVGKYSRILGRELTAANQVMVSCTNTLVCQTLIGNAPSNLHWVSRCFRRAKVVCTISCTWDNIAVLVYTTFPQSVNYCLHKRCVCMLAQSS